jgi:hypothetical protein
MIALARNLNLMDNFRMESRRVAEQSLTSDPKKYGEITMNSTRLLIGSGLSSECWPVPCSSRGKKISARTVRIYVLNDSYKLLLRFCASSLRYSLHQVYHRQLLTHYLPTQSSSLCTSQHSSQPSSSSRPSPSPVPDFPSVITSASADAAAARSTERATCPTAFTHANPGEKPEDGSAGRCAPGQVRSV